MPDRDYNQFKKDKLDKSYDKFYQQQKKERKEFAFHIGSSIFGFVITFLVLTALIRSFYGSNPLTFTGLLDFMSNNTMTIGLFDFNSFMIGGSWGIVDFLRNFLNTFFILPISLVIWIANNLINVILFAFQMVRFIFI